MKKPVIIISLVIIGLLALFSVVAFCAVLVVDNYQQNDSDDISLSSTAGGVSKSTTANYWAQQMSKLESMQAEQAKTSTTTTAKKTTTTQRSWFTAKTSRSTLPSRSTSATEQTTRATTTTTTHKASKTTRLATAAEKEAIYRSVSAEVTELYEDYKAVRQERIAEIDAEIAPLQARASALYTQYMQDKRQLATRCEAMGMSTSSGYYKAQAEALTNQYQTNLAPISEQIAELKDEKEIIQSALTESEGQLEAVIQAEYLAAVEEFQQSTLG